MILAGDFTPKQGLLVIGSTIFSFVIIQFCMDEGIALLAVKTYR